MIEFEQELKKVLNNYNISLDEVIKNIEREKLQISSEVVEEEGIVEEECVVGL